MTNSTRIDQVNPVVPTTARFGESAASRPGRLRRSLTGLVAAVGIAFGGSALLGPQQAQAAGVHTQNYVHTQASENSQASAHSQGSTGSTRARTSTPYAVQTARVGVKSTERERRSA